ncbi:hypothetical protein WJX82_008432 [Trebouxia sp. C0006]
MAHNDLAYCSEWGHNRVLEHKATSVPLNLILPVLTKPEIVEQAVAGVLSGQISLSMSNVEAVLVLANAVGFVSLEMACVDYLCVQAQRMTVDVESLQPSEEVVGLYLYSQNIKGPSGHVASVHTLLCAHKSTIYQIL